MYATAHGADTELTFTPCSLVLVMTEVFSYAFASGTPGVNRCRGTLRSAATTDSGSSLIQLQRPPVNRNDLIGHGATQLIGFHGRSAGSLPTFSHSRHPLPCAQPCGCT